jgi:DNA polymerase I
MNSLPKTTEPSQGRAEEGTVERRSPLRMPHVILNLAEVHRAVEELMRGDSFVLDVETHESIRDHPNPRTNELRWIGLGGRGQVYLIPTGHPKGVVLQQAHKEKTAAFLHYGEDDPRGRTPKGSPSFRMIEHTVAATYAPPPKQLTPDVVMKALKPLLFSDLPKLGHNVKFDLQTVAKYYGEIPPGPYHDTILVRHTLDENLRDYRLKQTTRDWLGLAAKDYPELGRLGTDNFGLDEVARYLAMDLRYCWLQFQYFYPRLVRKGLKRVYDFEMSVYPVLMEMEQHGFPVDRSNLGEVRTELEERLTQIEKRCWHLAGDIFPLSNTNAKRWVMFGEGEPVQGQHGLALQSQNLRILSRTPKTSIPQITKGVLEYYVNRGNAMAELFLDWSATDKLRGTFIEGLDALVTDIDMPRIHTSFNQHRTTTGRLSSAGPNLQNLPRRTIIRSLFVAGRGHVLIVADYDQIELRCLALESGDPVMCRVFRQGGDIHVQAAAGAFRISVEGVTADQRQVGKTLNFATSYGAEAARVASVAGVSVRRGQQILDRYYEQFALLKPWKARTLREAKARGDRANVPVQPPAVVIPPTGRLRRLPNLFSSEDGLRAHAERQAINAVIQGFASNITKMAMVNLRENLQGYPAHMVLQVHDEIVTRVEERYVDEVMSIVTSTMSDIRDDNGQPILGNIPLLVSTAVGGTWAEAKGK